MEVLDKLLEKSNKSVSIEKKELLLRSEKDKVTQILLALSKINIESGELNKNVLEYVELSSKYKINNFKSENLEVIISELLFEILNLSNQLNVDVKKALQKKLDLLEKIDKI
jgi:NTP pyrophosphatase (non-canonical NTP hydrolase)